MQLPTIELIRLVNPVGNLTIFVPVIVNSIFFFKQILLQLKNNQMIFTSTNVRNKKRNTFSLALLLS